MRLDTYIAANGLAKSREKAVWLIENGFVRVDGKITLKTSTKLSENQKVEVDEVKVYVGRGALKLKGVLEDYPIQISGKKCLDIGASTGGFTEILLENGAASVYAVDVGSMQLSEELKNNNLVKSFENTDIRDFKPESVFEIVSVDLSFVSTKELLPIIVPLSSDVIIILFKPQFEVGKNAKRDKKGVVTDTAAIMRAIFDFELEAKAFGLDVLYKAPCKFAGKEGNQEYFYVFKVCS